ncbi:MAG: L-fucose isomerase [Spirochaetes bacterium]|nr:L-fucose isomerase [Spirochaetota bacterium]
MAEARWENRRNNELPSMGILPVIDGRRDGVRESLEAPIMAMARSVADLLSKEVRHPCGRPLRCVVPEIAVGGVAESARAHELFRREYAGGIIHVTRCWCYASEIIGMDAAVPTAIWGFNGTRRPGAVYLAGAMAAAAQKGLPAFKIYGRDVQDEEDFEIPGDVRERLLRFARCAVAVATMRGTSYLSMGGVSMGIGGSIVDPDFFQAYLGMRCQYVDMSEFTRRIEGEIYDGDEYRRAMAWVKAHCIETEDPNPPDRRESREQRGRRWETSVKMALIARDLMVGNRALADLGYQEEAEGHNAIAGGFQGQRQWTDFMPSGDFMEAMLNSSFDWNGIREPYIIATENDSLNALSMLFGRLLTGTAQIFADVRTLWSPAAIRRVTGRRPGGALAGGFIYLTNSGAAALDGTGCQERGGEPAMKPFWEITEEEARACVAATRWGPAKLATFRGGGFSSSYRSRGGMPMTMTRLNLVKGLGPVLQVIQGRSVDLPPEMEREIVRRTDPTWPRTFFVPETDGGDAGDVYDVMNRWGANHCALCYGHVGADLISLASMLRIPVAMHNVAPERLFRPAAWDSFGTADPQGADFRACAAFGPLYGRY